MKIVELIETNEQISEGPILNKIGRGIGNVAGTVAKGVGAVAGGVAGLGSALKKGYQAGKDVVGAGGDEPAPTAGPAAGQATTPAPASAGQAAPSGALAAPASEPTTNNGAAAGTATRAATVPPKVDVQGLQTQIAQKEKELEGLKSQLATAQKPDPAAVRQEKQAAAAKVAQDQMAANPAPTEPAAAEPAPAAEPDAQAQLKQKFATDQGLGTHSDGKSFIQPGDKFDMFTGQPLNTSAPQAEPAAPATTPAPETNPAKPSPEEIKQAQLKKDLLKKQQARQAGGSAPSGFAASGVGKERNRIYTGADGAPKSYTVRESVEFYSNFLGKNI